jgi:hypothetical protein
VSSCNETGVEDYILWHIDLFISNDREINNKTMAVTRQQILNRRQLNYNNRGTAGNGFFLFSHAKGLYNEDTSLGAQFSVESQSCMGVREEERQLEGSPHSERT